MPRTGRPPKPVEQHKRVGTFRADRHSSALAVVPVSPQHPSVSLTALEAVDRVVEAGAVWLGESDMPTIVLLREVLERRERCEDIRQWVDLTKAATGLMSQLGFDPTARARLGLAEIKAASKLDQLKGRQTNVAHKGSAG